MNSLSHRRKNRRTS